MVIGGFAREVSELLGGVAAADPDPLAAMVGMGSETSATPPEDPAVRRLLPDAYDDPAGAAEFRRLTDDELRRGETSAVTRLAGDGEGSGGGGAGIGDGGGGGLGAGAQELPALRRGRVEGERHRWAGAAGP